MWWIPLAVSAVQALNAKEKNAQTQAFNKGQAEVTRYSPWTGMSGQMQQQGPSSLAAGAGGYIQGMGIQQGMGAGGGGSAPQQMSGPSDGMMAGSAWDQMNTGYQQKPNLFSRTG